MRDREALNPHPCKLRVQSWPRDRDRQCLDFRRQVAPHWKADFNGARTESRPVIGPERERPRRYRVQADDRHQERDEQPEPRRRSLKGEHGFDVKGARALEQANNPRKKRPW